jgi:hypothetical protein
LPAGIAIKEGKRKPETLAFLGFTHICGRSCKGKFMLLRHTIAKRQKAKLKEIKRELKSRRHDPIPEQGSLVEAVSSPGTIILWCSHQLEGPHAVPARRHAALAAFTSGAAVNDID